MLRICGRDLDPRLVVLDKDGTLLAFAAMWHTWFAALREALDDEGPLSEEARAGLAATLGYDARSGAWEPLGPLSEAPTHDVLVLIAGQLYAHTRMPWDDSLARVQRALDRVQRELPVEALAQPLGDVRGWLERVRASGALLALATTDQRAETERALAHLGILRLFATTVCGDDGIALKPNPQMVLEICARLRVAPQESIMVGDTVADLVMARQAGLACAIGVTSGAMPHDLLAPHADLVVPDIHAIEVITQSERG